MPFLPCWSPTANRMCVSWHSGPPRKRGSAHPGDLDCNSVSRRTRAALSDCPPLELDERAATCVVVASGGYPVKHETGFPITGLDHAEELDDVVVFHAGTAEVDGKVVTSGGRVLGVTAVGDTIRASIDRAYEAVDRIEWKGMHVRRDIGGTTS